MVLMLRLESTWHGKSVDHVLTYFGRQIAVGSQNPSRITRQKTCCASESNTSESSWHGRSVDHDLTYSGRQIAVGSKKPSRITRQKTCCASESNTLVRVVFTNGSGFDAPIGVVLAWEEHGSCLNIFRTRNRGRIPETFTNYEAKDLLRNESNTSVRIVFANESGFDAPIGVVLAWEERGSCINIFRTTNRGRLSETLTNYEAKDLFRKVVLMLRLESTWHGRSVNHVLTYSGRQIAVGSLKPSRITRQKTCYASEPNTSVRVVFANGSGFDTPIGVVLAWEELGSCLNIFRTTNRSRISKTFTNYEAEDLLRKHGRSVHHVLTYSGRKIAVGSQKPSRFTRQKTCCASESNASVRVVLANRNGFDAPIGVVLAWEDRGSCINIFWTTNRSRISETFTNYDAKDLLRKQKTFCASESNTSVRVVFANGSGFDALIGVVLAWDEHGSCLNIFRTTNRGRISETFLNYEAKDLLRKRVKHVETLTYSERITRQKTFCASESNTSVRVVFANRSGLMLRLESSWHGRSVDHVLTYSGLQIAVGSHKPSRIRRQKTYCASESNTSSGFDAPIGVVLAWEERGSCLNIFRTTNHGRISETLMNYEAKDLLRNLDHVLTYFGRKIAVGSQKLSRITREKTCCASKSNTLVRVVFANRSGFDSPIGVVLACKERGSCLKIFWTTNRGRISETFMNYEAIDLLHDKLRSDLRNLHELRGKRLVAQVSQTRQFALYSRTGVVLMLRLESSWHGRSVDHVSTYSGRHFAIGSQKPSRITRQKTCCASESNASVRVVLANRSGFDAPIGVVLAWEERGSCLNIFRTTNRDRISETFTNYEAKDLLRKSVDHVLTYSGRQIAVESQKPSRITRQKTCCASVSNTSVRVVFANRSGFDAPIGVVLAWEERGSCLNIFRMTNRVRISETFTNYKAKDLLRKSQKPSRIMRQKTCCVSELNTSIVVVFVNGSGFDALIGVVLAWEERGSCLNIFRRTNRGRICETFTNYEAKDLLRKNLHELQGKSLVAHVSQTRQFAMYSRTGVVLMLRLESSWHGRSVDHVSTYSGRQIEKPSRITRQKTCYTSESNTSVRVVFANRSGFDAPIGVVLAWEERGSCLNIFRMTNRGRISEIFTNYEAKDLLRK
ncbi:uncharacterized protein G2W53_009841 [Senna tora]|uniref:Uncharacterized protein n=1 Tax=Senna tora TaxID=362788 RepID=A0A834WYP0_9FABA|nr:uncharacterized protein G2W53_009841 [Senna tora]